MNATRVIAWLAAKWPGEQRRRQVADAYAAIFSPGNRAGELIRRDLAMFCHQSESTMMQAVPDREIFAAEGRRQTYLHICEMARVDPGDVPPG